MCTGSHQTGSEQRHVSDSMSGDDGGSLNPTNWTLFSRQMRKDYIIAKYTEKRFARRLCPDATSRQELLYEAVRNRDVLSLIQVYSEGVDLMEARSQPNEHV